MIWARTPSGAYLCQIHGRLYTIRREGCLGNLASWAAFAEGLYIAHCRSLAQAKRLLATHDRLTEQGAL